MRPQLGPGEYICNDCGKTKTRNEMKRVNALTPTGQCLHCYHLKNHVRWFQERAVLQHMHRYMPETTRVIYDEQWQLHKDDTLVQTRLQLSERRTWRQADTDGH